MDPCSRYQRGVLAVEGWDKLLHLCHNIPSVSSYEQPTTNGFSNARSLARMAAVMAGKGRVDDVRLFSEDTWQRMMRRGEPLFDVLVGKMTRWTSGGLAELEPSEFGGQEGWYGWTGWGGSLIMFNPSKNHALALTLTGTRHTLYDERRWWPLLQAVGEALK